MSTKNEQQRPEKINYVKAVSFYPKRALKLLERFDTGDHDALFYAALELRMGIEAKLYETINSSRSLRKLPPKKVSDYKVKKLLARLAKLDPDSDKRIDLVFTLSPAFALRVSYLPLSTELAEAHEKLGDLLHYGFFESHPRFF